MVLQKTYSTRNDTIKFGIKDKNRDKISVNISTKHIDTNKIWKMQRCAVDFIWT